MKDKFYLINYQLLKQKSAKYFQLRKSAAQWWWHLCNVASRSSSLININNNNLIETNSFTALIIRALRHAVQVLLIGTT